MVIGEKNDEVQVDIRETVMEESNEDTLPGIALDTKFSFKTHLQSLTVFQEEYKGSRASEFTKHFRSRQVFVEYTCFSNEKVYKKIDAQVKSGSYLKACIWTLVHYFCREFTDAMAAVEHFAPLPS